MRIPVGTGGLAGRALACAAFTAVTSAAHAQPAPAPAAPAPSASAAWVGIATTSSHVALERRIGSLDPVTAPLRGGTPAPGEAPPAYRPPASYGPYFESDWESVCPTPCQKPVALGGEYRIGGEGITPSNSFQIHGPRTVLNVDPGSKSLRGLGTYMTVFGFLLAATGGIFLVMSLASTEKKSESGDRLVTILSTTDLVAGSVIGLTGIGFMVGSGTTVRDEQGKEIAKVTRRPVTLNAVGRF